MILTGGLVFLAVGYLFLEFCTYVALVYTTWLRDYYSKGMQQGDVSTVLSDDTIMHKYWYGFGGKKVRIYCSLAASIRSMLDIIAVNV